MGAELVSLALVRWTHVSDRAFRVLVRMALTALDKPGKGRPAAVYHGGRDLLAMSLRSEKGTPETRYRSVKRALAELTEAGAIRHVRSGWAGQNSVYLLTLEGARNADEDPVDNPVDNFSEFQRMGGPTSPPVGGPTSPPKGGPGNVPKGGPTDPPKEPRGTSSSGAREDTGVDLQTTSHPPRAPEPEEPPKVVEIFPGAAQEAPYRPPPRWSTSAMNAVAEATARRAARRAEYQAQLAAEKEAQ